MYTPVKNGFGQSIYTDAMGTAFVGQLANASDKNMVDAAIVGEDVDFAFCGGVYGLKMDATGIRPGINSYEIVPFGTEGAQACIVVRNQQTETNDDGLCGWYSGSVANILRVNRVGGRVWCNIYATSAITSASTLSVVSAVTTSTIPVGTLTTEESIDGATLTAIAGLGVIGSYTPDTDGYVPAVVEVNFALSGQTSGNDPEEQTSGNEPE